MKAAAFVLTLVTAGAACADETADLARHHYEEATAAYNLGDFVRAVQEYRESYKLVHDPVLLYDAAQACRLGNDPQQAIFLYRSYLRGLPDAPNRKQVEERIATLERQLATRPPPPLPPSERPTEAAPTAQPAPVITASPQSTPPMESLNRASSRPVRTRTPVYKKWWLWTIVGVVAAGAAAGIAVGIVTASGTSPSTGLGVVNVF